MIRTLSYPRILIASIVLMLMSFASTSLAEPIAPNKQTYASLADFIKAQNTIRVTADDGPGFGDQAASMNIVRWLRETEKYTGNIEFIYSYGENTKGKIISLFNLPPNIEDDYTDTAHKIRFIKINTFLKNRKEMKEIALGMNGGISEGLCFKPQNALTDIIHYDPALYTDLSEEECKNVAKFYNTELFVQIEPFPLPKNSRMGEVHLSHPKEGQSDWAGIYNDNTFIPVSEPISLEETKQTVTNSTLIETLPALNNFIDGIINEDFNILPVYGASIKSYPYLGINERYLSNMLQIITAARYAQQHGLNSEKPIIIAVFYNYDKEIQALNEIIRNGNWDILRSIPTAEELEELKHSYNYEGGEKQLADDEAQYSIAYSEAVNEMKSVVKQLNLANDFFVTSLNQADAKNIFEQIRANDPQLKGKIILLSMGQALPKNVFDAIYAHKGNNVLPQIREGANSFNVLITSGKPHFRCAESVSDKWELGYDLINDPNLKNMFSQFYEDVSANMDQDMQNMFCQGIGTWQNNSTLYQTLGQWFVDSTNPNSAISKYFQLLREEAIKPGSDRIARALEFGLNILQQNN